MLRLAFIVTALVTTACGGKAKQPAAAPAAPAATESAPGGGSAGSGDNVPNADAPAEEGGTMRGDPCDGGE